MTIKNNGDETSILIQSPQKGRCIQLAQQYLTRSFIPAIINTCYPEKIMSQLL
jgi:hypothetical protein